MSGASPIAGRRVLVTGAAGFLGRHLCRRLTQCGALVDGLGRGLPPKGIELRRWHQADCAAIADVRAAFAATDPEIVFHLAGFADGKRELEFVLPALHGDLVTAVNVLTVATERNCQRLVLAGSLEEPTWQQGLPAASSPYAAAKIAGTIYAKMFHELYRTPVVTGRVFMTYGPGQRAHKIVPYTIRALLRGEAPQLGAGERPVDWIFVEDTVEGLLSLATATGVEGQVLDIGSGSLVSVRSLVEQITAAFGGDVQPDFGVLPARAMEQIACADVERTSTLTGWRPRISLEAGLARTILWYRTLESANNA